MSKSGKRDGGPAFPESVGIGASDDIITSTMHGNPGMSLRDFFAIKALASIMAADGPQYIGKSAPQHAEMAYFYADMMIMERDK